MELGLWPYGSLLTGPNELTPLTTTVAPQVSWAFGRFHKDRQVFLNFTQRIETTNDNFNVAGEDRKDEKVLGRKQRLDHLNSMKQTVYDSRFHHFKYEERNNGWLHQTWRYQGRIG